MRRSSIFAIASMALCASAHAGEPEPARAERWIVAVGDSLAFGLQQEKLGEDFDAARFRTGFVDEFARRAAETAAGRALRTVNFACPGETAASFLEGPCAWREAGLPLHEDYEGPQMEAAERFLEEHDGQVDTILVSLGANDLNTQVERCGGLYLGCLEHTFPSAVARFEEDEAAILERLRAAAPEAEILVLAPYSAYTLLVPESYGFGLVLARAVERAATEAGDAVVNAFDAFNGGVQPGHMCLLTNICVPAHDIHPTDEGYRLIADLFWAASGYSRSEE
jgi:lysophospholipase L1-like esterase